MVENHNGLGHFGEKATVETISKRMWWPGLASDVSRFVSECPDCQRNKRDPLGPKKEPLHPLPIPKHAFSRWSLDFIGELPETETGNRWIITGICHSTGWPIARATTDATEETVATFIYEEIFMRFGVQSRS